MLKQPNRLSSDFEFKITKKYGQKVYSEFLFVYFLSPTNYKGEPKFGIVISNKFDKRAVVRNRVKRLISEALVTRINLFPNDTWTVIYPNKKVLDVSYEKICSDVDQVLQKISVS